VVWVVAAAVGAVIVIGTTAAFIVMHYAKKRQRQRDRELHPYLQENNIVEGGKKHRHVFASEEERRKHMIRKSLAERSTDSDSGGSGFSAMMDLVDRELAQMERQETTKLKDDYKKWEAGERKKRSKSGGQHPAASAASSVPVLEMPSPAKHRSHGRRASVSPPPSPPSPAHLPRR
jgi:hypothetical protein